MNLPTLVLSPRLWIGSCVVLLAGCAGDRVLQDPPMPTVVPVAVAPAVSVEVAEARAKVLALRGDSTGAIKEIEAVDAEQRGPAFLRVEHAVVREDPARAAALALAYPAGTTRSDAVALATRGLLARDRDAALAWALDLKDPSAHFAALEALATEMVAQDPRAAVDRIQALPSRPERMQLLRLAASRWAKRDANAALSWAGGLQEPLRTEMTSSIGFEVAQTNPVRAARIAAELPGGRDRSILFSAVGQTWIAREPGAADAWLRSLPAGPDKDAALAGIATATSLARSRRPGSPQSTYRSSRVGGGGGVPTVTDVTSLPPGQRRQAAVAREFQQRLMESPTRAADWLATLPSPDVTDDMLRQLTQEWTRRDPAAARTWLELHVPTAPRREQILQEIVP
jgi:hypothetical protein